MVGSSILIQAHLSHVTFEPSPPLQEGSSGLDHTHLVSMDGIHADALDEEVRLPLVEVVDGVNQSQVPQSLLLPPMLWRKVYGMDVSMVSL